MKFVKYFEDVKPFHITTPQDREEWSTVKYNEEEEIEFLTNLFKKCLSDKKEIKRIDIDTQNQSKSVIIKSIKKLLKEI
jgi:hypothetical protein